LNDPRKRRAYSIEEILIGGASMFLFKLGSRNSINNKRREEAFEANYRECFGLRLPHQDTVADVLCQIDPDELEHVKMELMSSQFEQKWLRKYRLLDEYYTIAVDATGVVSFTHPHCEHCLTKMSKNGKTTYFHYVLEAKLVTSAGYSLSLASEWVENPTVKFNKQDCELKAFSRLAAKLKKSYPRLPVCILGDGLYANSTVFNICENNGWKYLIVLQDDQLRSVQDEVDIIRMKKPAKDNYVVKNGWRINSEYRFHTDISYKHHIVHWLECVESRKRDVMPGQKSEKETTSKFEYVTNIKPSNKTVTALCSHGRLRWKVENEGFNSQKNGGYELEHKYFRKSYRGLKNCYALLQIAHFINQLVEKSEPVIVMLKMHSKETIRNIWSNLISYMVMIMPYNCLCNPPPP